MSAQRDRSGSNINTYETTSVWRRSSSTCRQESAISNIIISATAETNVRKTIKGWIYEDVQPDIYAVCTAYQGLWRENGIYRTYEAGDHILYEKLASSFRHRLSKAVYPSCYKKYQKRKKKCPKLIPMSGTLEGDGKGRHYHLNFFVKRPAWMMFGDFEALFKSAWSQSEWAHRHSDHAVKFQERRADCVGYGLKEGSQTLLVF